MRTLPATAWRVLFRRHQHTFHTSRAGGSPTAEEFIIRSEFPSVPVANSPFHETLLKAILRHAREQTTRPALICAENTSDRITYGEFYVKCYSIATYLESIGFGRGDIAGAVLPNCWQYLALFVACSMRGGAISGSNSSFTANELCQQFNDSQASIVFTSDKCVEKVKAASVTCPRLERIVVLPMEPASVGEISKECPPGKCLVSFAEVEATVPNEDKMVAERSIVPEEDILLLPYSSGTTGPPKGVMLTHKSFGTMVNIYNEHFDRRVIGVMDPQWESSRGHQCLLLPLHHIYGFTVAINSLLAGGCGLMLRQFDPHVFCRTIQNYKVETMDWTIDVTRRGGASPPYDLSTLRFVMTGAAPVGRELMDEVLARYPSVEQISQGYGMTEQSMASHLPVFGMDNPTAAGRLIANLEMKVVDVESGQPLPTGKVGEIYTRGPTIMRGYLNRPKETAECIDNEGWLRTGDVGYHDAEGWTYVVDRLKELIKVKGFQVAPAELEDVLLSHPGVKDAAVIGVKDEMAGEAPKAFIVKATPELEAMEIMDYIKDRVAGYKQLRGGVEFVDEIPKSPSGKILRRLLRAKAG